MTDPSHINPAQSPFKFLDSYTREDRDVFFGREREIEEMYQKIFDGKILLLYGISGTGKTSLINCGLANKFQESDWLPVTIRRGRDIMESIREELAKVVLTPVKKGSDIPGMLQSIYLDHFKPVYLIFDQFEELFIFGEREERDEFIQTVNKIIQSEINCRFIFSVREEYLANITEFEEVIDHFLDNRMRIEKMTRTHAVEVIEGPCRVHGIELERGFANLLLDKLNPEAKDVELTYLQIFLDRIYQDALRTEGDIRFSNELIERTGDVGDLLGAFLDEQVGGLSDPDAGLTLLKAFVSIKGTKRQIREEEVQNYVKALGKQIGEEQLKELVQSFVKLRILRDKDENGRYELRHDSLAAKIFEKITLVEKELLEIRQFIDNAYENYVKREIYLSREDLEYIAPYEKKLYLDKKQNDFVDQCHKKLAAGRKSFRRILILSMIGFILTLAGIGVYSLRYSKGAKAEKLARLASLQKDFSLPMSLEFARQAYRKDTTSSLAVRALFDAFYGLLEAGPWIDSLGRRHNPDSMIFNFVPLDENIARVKYSGDGSLIYGYLANNSIRIWESSGEEVYAEPGNDKSVLDLLLSPDNRKLAVLYADSTAVLKNLDGRDVCTLHVTVNFRNPHQCFAFTPDSKMLASAGRGNRINFMDMQGNILYSLEGHTAAINAVSISPDGRYMVSASNDSTVRIWAYEDSLKCFTYFRQAEKFDSEAWSVDFAGNSMYYLCVGRDSIAERWYHSISIGNLNGKRRYIMSGDHSDSLESCGWFCYRGIPSHAAFTGGDIAIIYSDTLLSVSDNVGIRFSWNSPYSLNETHKLIAVDSLVRQSDLYTFSYCDVSEPGYFVSNIAGETHSHLIHWDRVPLRKLQGTHPVFSPDGQNVLCIDDNRLILYPANEKEILRLVDELKIFGEPDYLLREWRHAIIDWR